MLDHINNPDLSVTELTSIAKNRGIKKYNKLDKDELLKNVFFFSFLSLNEYKSISKLRKIKNYGNISEDELLNFFENSKHFKDSKETNTKSQDDDEVIMMK